MIRLQSGSPDASRLLPAAEAKAFQSAFGSLQSNVSSAAGFCPKLAVARAQHHG
jgi:hypothetical protein